MALRGKYDLVLLDLMLPGLSGTSVLRRMIETRPEQRVVVCSATTDPAQKAQCHELGAVGLHHETVRPERAHRPACDGTLGSGLSLNQRRKGAIRRE